MSLGVSGSDAQRPAGVFRDYDSGNGGKHLPLALEILYGQLFRTEHFRRLRNYPFEALENRLLRVLHLDPVMFQESEDVEHFSERGRFGIRPDVPSGELAVEIVVDRPFAIYPSHAVLDVLVLPLAELASGRIPLLSGFRTFERVSVNGFPFFAYREHLPYRLLGLNSDRHRFPDLVESTVLKDSAIDSAKSTA